MSKKTPEIKRTSDNFYKTPIREKRLHYNNINENDYKQIDNKLAEEREKQTPLNLSFPQYDREKSSNKKIENELIYPQTPRTNSDYKKIFQSPYINFLTHPHESFMNYLDNFSRSSIINVLDFKNKQKMLIL